MISLDCNLIVMHTCNNFFISDKFQLCIVSCTVEPFTVEALLG